MPAYMLGLPVSSSALKISHNNVDYDLLLGTDTFTRAGKDGNEPILPLNGGCEFVGEALPGEWKKDWDDDIVKFTAMHFRFVDPVVASTRLEVRSSAGGDTTQTLTVTGIVAGVRDTEAFVLTGAAWVNGTKNFTEVWKMELNAVCVGTVTVQDSEDNAIYVLPIGDLLRERFTSLMMGGKTHSADTLEYGWINNHHPFVMMNDAELTVELEIPTADTIIPNEDIHFEFYIRRDKAVTSPSVDPDFILIRQFVDTNGLILQLYKEVGGVNTLLWDGSTANGNTSASTDADQFWIFRFVFHDGVAGATAPEDVRHMHVYAKHGDSRVAAEAATEEALSDSGDGQESPYDISDLLFNVGYPAYQIVSASDEWFGTSVGSGLEAISTYLRISYPTLFALKYDFVDASYGYGDVELWDTKGSVTEADWMACYDEDHDFGTNNLILQNGLIRLRIDRLQQYGLEFYFYDTGASAWVQPFDQLYFDAITSNKDLSYPVIQRIESISPERTAIIVRLHDTNTENNDYYIDVRITLERGRYSLKLDSLDVFPDQDVKFLFLDTATVRFGYVGDDEIGDDDINIDGDNTTMTDNFLIAFDDDGETVLGAVFTDEEPTGSATPSFLATDGGDLAIEDIDATDIAGTIIWVSLIPFPLVANLFAEAENLAKTTITAAARLNCDGEGEDTVTEGQAVWAATLNCGVDVNDASLPPEVGVKDVKITAGGVGAVQSTCTPGAPLGKLTKFDNLILWMREGDGAGSVRINLFDADVDSVFITQAVDNTATQYTIPLPHSATDLQGWTQVGTYDFETFTAMRFDWTSVGGVGASLWIDGLHFYIGTTTIRGRGETLSGGEAVVLDAQGEIVTYTPTLGTDLPAGRYLVVFRAKDTDQVVTDLRNYCYDATDDEYRNQENIDKLNSLTDGFEYYSLIAFISEADAAAGNTSRFPSVEKQTNTENTIFIDYFVLFPIGDGKSWPQDLAHAALRTFTKPRRLYVR